MDGLQPRRGMRGCCGHELWMPFRVMRLSLRFRSVYVLVKASNLLVFQL